MICIAIQESRLDKLLEDLEGIDFAEIRMELLGPSLEDVQCIFSLNKRLIATMRPGEYGDKQRASILVAAIEAGATFVDVEIESPKWLKDKVVGAARRSGCQVIVSYHDFEGTPSKSELDAIVSDCFDAGADIAKVVCQVRSHMEGARLLALLDSDRQVIAFGMGEAGKVTRIAGPLLGSPFTYASRSKGLETAKGQLDGERLRFLIDEIRRS